MDYPVSKLPEVGMTYLHLGEPPALPEDVSSSTLAGIAMEFNRPSASAPLERPAQERETHHGKMKARLESQRRKTGL